jgi:hypothetical protein
MRMYVIYFSVFSNSEQQCLNAESLFVQLFYFVLYLFILALTSRQ